MAEEKKQPHEKLADKELDLTAAQEVRYSDDFKKADKAGKGQKEQNEDESQEDK